MTLAFADPTAVAETATALVRKQAEYDATVLKCNKIMLPLHEQLQAAKAAFDKACSDASEVEQVALSDSVNLNTLLDLAETAEREEAATQAAIKAAAQLGAAGLMTSTPISDLPGANDSEVVELV